MLQTPPVLQAQFPRRVIAHIDLDCFYCQVEQKRLNIPADVPCAVQQWEGLIAVNYAARAAGITRHMRVGEAKKKCPELQLVHVQTIGGAHATVNQPSHGLHLNPSPNAPAAQAGLSQAPHAGQVQQSETAPGLAAEAGIEGSAADRGTAKASLQRYRKASAGIMRLLAQMSPGCAFEKASIDEAYLDITRAAAEELAKAEAVDGGLPELLAEVAAGSSVLGDGGLQADVEFDRLAAAGAAIVIRLRQGVFDQLGFTCSAGIAPNKLLAKIGSAKNKPNKQTLVLPRAVDMLMQDLPLGKVKGLGGKLGAKLEDLGATTAGAAAHISWETLVQALGSKALWVWETVRGVDNEAVTCKSLVKSINSCKSFEPTSDQGDVRKWLGVLAAELAERIAEDETDHLRRARTLVLQYRTSSVRNALDRSVRGALPRCGRDGHSTEAVAAAGFALFKRITPAPFPLVRLALAATDFVDLPGHRGSSSSAALARFLVPNKQQQQQHSKQAPREQELPTITPVSDQQQNKYHAGYTSHYSNQSQHELQLTKVLQQHDGAVHEQYLTSQHHTGGLQCPSIDAARLCVGAEDRAFNQKTGSESQQDAQQAGPGQIQPANRSVTSTEDTACLQRHCTGAAAPDQTSLITADQGVTEADVFAAQQTSTGVHHQVDAVDTLPTQPQPSHPADQEESVEQLAALAGVSVRDQARIMRDIEIQGMLQRRRHQEQRPGMPPPARKSAGVKQPASHKRKAPEQLGKQNGRQMRISSLFGAAKPAQ